MKVKKMLRIGAWGLAALVVLSGAAAVSGRVWLFSWSWGSTELTEFHESWTPAERAALSKLYGDLKKLPEAVLREEEFDSFQEKWKVLCRLRHTFREATLLLPQIAASGRSAQPADADSIPPALAAAALADTEACLALIHHGADPNQLWKARPIIDGYSPLRETALTYTLMAEPGVISGSGRVLMPEERLRNVQQLLDAGADPAQLPLKYGMEVVYQMMVGRGNALYFLMVQRGMPAESVLPYLSPELPGDIVPIYQHLIRQEKVDVNGVPMVSVSAAEAEREAVSPSSPWPKNLLQATVESPDVVAMLLDEGAEANHLPTPEETQQLWQAHLEHGCDESCDDETPEPAESEERDGGGEKGLFCRRCSKLIVCRVTPLSLALAKWDAAIGTGKTEAADAARRSAELLAEHGGEINVPIRLSDTPTRQPLRAFLDAHHLPYTIYHQETEPMEEGVDK